MAFVFIKSCFHLQHLFFDRLLHSNDRLDKEPGYFVHHSLDRLFDGIYHQSFFGVLLFDIVFDLQKKITGNSFMAAYRQYFIFSDSNLIHLLFK